MKCRLMTSSPSKAMTTVPPANRAERPAVLRATSVAASGVRPSASSWRYRVTMSRA